MARVYYGLAGDGHGHATRATTVIEHLLQDHEVIALTFGKASRLLRNRFASSQLELREVDGLRFEYGLLGRVSPSKTILKALPTLRKMIRQSDALVDELRERADLVISDFEPVSARAAKLAGVPSLGIDHQRFLQACRFDDASLTARAKIRLMVSIMEIVYPLADTTLISGFYLPPFREGYEHCRPTGPLLRRAIIEATPTEGEHLLAYVRHDCPKRVLSVLEQSPFPIRLYGMGEHPERGAIQFRPIADQAFVDDLASCRGVVTTAGNQLIGEAFALGKPCLAFPEPGNTEQHINAALIEQSGGGEAISHRNFDIARLERFVASLNHYRERLRTIGGGGNTQVFEIVDSLLARGPAPRVSRTAQKCTPGSNGALAARTSRA